VRKNWPKSLLVVFFYAGRILAKIPVSQGERSVEYPWILREIKRIDRRARVLDIGCVDSLLSHALVMNGYDTYGIDARPYLEAHPKLRFILGDITNSGLPNSFFDCVVANSVLEHIGLDSPDYHDPLHEDGDFLAIKEIKRILKKGGILILTLPLGAEHRATLHGGVKLRIYDQERLSKLAEGFQILRNDVFWRDSARWQETRRIPIRPANIGETDLIVCMTLKLNRHELEQ
jgi:SAM-dependent methyltransferase